MTGFSFGLGPFDPEDAVSTLPAQLEMMRLLRDLGRPDIVLRYRLSTETRREPVDHIAARFSIHCEAGTDAKTEVEELEDIATVVLVDGWHITPAPDANPPRRGWSRVALVPATGTGHLPVTPDWAPLVDILRRLAIDAEIELECRYVRRAPGAPGIDPPTIEHAVREGPERTAASFFANAALAVEDRADGLRLGLRVRSIRPIGRVMLALIGRMILGVAVEVAEGRGESKRDLVLHPEIAIRAFHPPLGHIQGRGLVGDHATSLSTKFPIPKIEGSALGTAVSQGTREDSSAAIRLSDRDRLKHVYVVGKTGSGKTNLLMSLARQDIKAGKGVLVIDPHGSLVDHLVSHLGGRQMETVLLDFSDPEYLPVINPLLTDAGGPLEAQHAIDELIDLLIGRTFNQFTGPVFESTLRTALETVLVPEMREAATPSAVGAVELIRQAHLHAILEDRLRASHPGLAAEWKSWKDLNPSNKAETSRWATSKLNDFGPGSTLRLVSSGPSTLSIDDVVRNRGILLIKIPDAHLGSRAAEFIGGLVFSRIRRALMTHPDPSRPYYAFIDEFQRFVRDDIEELVAEARKFGLGLVLAHQNIRQLNAFSRYEGTSNARLSEAIFSNVGTIVAMKTSGADVSTIATEFGVPERAVRRIGQYQALVRAVIDGEERAPFTLHAEHAEDRKGNMKHATTVRRRMIRHKVVRPRAELEEMITADLARLLAIGKPSTTTAKPGSSFLDEWLDKRRKGEAGERDTDDDIDDDGDAANQEADESGQEPVEQDDAS